MTKQDMVTETSLLSTLLDIGVGASATVGKYGVRHLESGEFVVSSGSECEVVTSLSVATRLMAAGW